MMSRHLSSKLYKFRLKILSAKDILIGSRPKEMFKPAALILITFIFRRSLWFFWRVASKCCRKDGFAVIMSRQIITSRETLVSFSVAFLTIRSAIFGKSTSSVPSFSKTKVSVNLKWSWESTLSKWAKILFLALLFFRWSRCFLQDRLDRRWCNCCCDHDIWNRRSTVRLDVNLMSAFYWWSSCMRVSFLFLVVVRRFISWFIYFFARFYHNRPLHSLWLCKFLYRPFDNFFGFWNTKNTLPETFDFIETRSSLIPCVDAKECRLLIPGSFFGKSFKSGRLSRLSECGGMCLRLFLRLSSETDLVRGGWLATELFCKSLLPPCLSLALIKCSRAWIWLCDMVWLG